MEKLAFKMKLKPGCKQEYKRRHDEIWPELKAKLKTSGIYDYTIFLDEETNTLFAVQRQEGMQSSQDLGNSDVIKKWWNFMSDLMETNADHSPVSVNLEKLFHMD